MSVSPSVSRKQLHTREIKCIGYERDDGLWDIEGRITDTFVAMLFIVSMITRSNSV